MPEANVNILRISRDLFTALLQEDVLAEIVKAESDAITYLDQLNK